MASVASFCLLTLLVLQPLVAGSDFLSPLLSPVLDEVCKKVECGKGTCNPSANSTFLYECQCDPGWKQTTFGYENGLKFLPCIVPNCTLDYSCAAAPAPVQDKSNRKNVSILDPCYWTDCGGGSCNRTSQFTYKCMCAEGYYNLFNASSFPCFRDCSIGLDCTSLGIPVSNRSSPPSPALPDNGGNRAGSILVGNIHWLIILGTSLAVGRWK